MDLKVLVNSCNFKVMGNYFIVAQLDELTFPEQNKKVQKARTEIQLRTQTPTFQKNMLTFKDLSFGSRLTLKLGVFLTRLQSDPGDNETLIANSKVLGSNAFTFTTRMLSVLREQKNLEQDIKILAVDGKDEEVGRIQMSIKYKSTTFEDKIEDDIHLVEQLYYDPFETNLEKIKENCAKIEKILAIKQEEAEKVQQKVNYMRNAHKSVSYDLGKLREERDKLEKDNNNLRDTIKKKNDVNEIHIHVDVLKNTDQGLDVLRQKLALLMNKLQFEQSVYKELTENYFSIEQQLKVAKNVKTDIETVKLAIEQQDFHIQRAKDQLPLVQDLVQTIKSQESIINNLREIIQDKMKENDKMTSKELELKVKYLKHEREILQEKEKQIDAIYHLSEGGQIPFQHFEKLKKDEYIRENPLEIKKYRERCEVLLQQIEKNTLELDKLNMKEDILQRQNQLFYKDDQTQRNRELLLLEIESKQNQANILQEEIVRMTRTYAQEVAELKAKITLLDNLIRSSGIDMRDNYY
ncbi:hypothetical protein TTHERM_00500850 (macronuclear) [Tetrahymena thermophila SB210]|uniref:Uncharacterized protein n=1 Tax=Tetrahymena thermophila (strain SB210) TaxID=312017 RepID=I7MGS8_TETTS|nr:hypothetical protein TTHERM_00500850 [Tetrahymena thermophila SB210]EAS01999.1 hypothetical protein TTHERM_00500850 [Tetrahymena thermophila SB210]|eukprot:XP_001022244.1 hypothetical protein TTHERM_00500850 [Tetrahymena thermophila SB210]